MARFGRNFLQAATQPAYLGGLFTAAQNIGQLPARAQRQQELSQFNPKTVEGLTGLAEYYQSEGDVANAAKYATASRALAAQETKQAQLVAFQEQVATAAESAGLPEQAKAARSTQIVEELRAINDDVRKFKISQLPLDNPAVINAQLRMAGFTPAQITAMGTLSKEDATALIEGRTGDLEAWLDKDGKVRAVNVNKFGLVYDEASKSYKQAAELGLINKAPQAQEIIDKTTNKQKEALAEAGVKHFVDMNEKARGARRAIQVIDRQMERVEGGMPTGVSANLEVTLKQVGQLLGRPYDPELISAQNYMQEAAELVKTEIKAFGSGTSITDADREYTQDMVGGDPRVQAEALLKLLEIRRRGFVETIQDYNDIRQGYVNQNMGDTLAPFPSFDVPQSVVESGEKAEAALPKGFILN